MIENEWKEAAGVVIDDSLAIKPGENVLIIAGESISGQSELNDLFAAIKEELHERGISLTVVSYFAAPGVEPPALVEHACLEADVMIFICARGFLHSSAYPRVQKNRKPGSRIVMLPNSNSKDYMNRIFPKTRERFYQIADTTAEIGNCFMGGTHKIRLVASNGTDMTFTIGNLSGWCHTGLAREPGKVALIPAGCLNVGVDEGTAEGVLVIDSYTALKPTMLENAITFRIQNGYACEVSGGSEAEDFLAAAQAVGAPMEQALCIAEFGVGFDPISDVNVNPSEGEHMYGAAHIGIGANVTFSGSVNLPGWHKDCILPDATVWVDDKLVLDHGKYLTSKEGEKH